MQKNRRKEILAWCFFDFGQSAFSTIIVTFIFSAYFARMIAVTDIEGIAGFGWALSFSGLLVAIASPFLGSIADQTSKKKPWLFVFTFFSIICTAALFFAQPYPSYLYFAILMFVAANTLVEVNQVFYNSYLPLIAPRKILGEISGYGWGSGYVGGLFALIAALIFFIQGGMIPKDHALNIRLTSLMAAVWMIIFCSPFFFYVKDRYLFEHKPEHVVRDGIKNVFTTLRSARQHKKMFQFLIARLIYTDAINTLLSLGGVFAAVLFDMRFEELLLFGISMNVSAGLGAFLLAKVDDKIGSAKMIFLSLICLIVLGFTIVCMFDKWIFWMIALSLGLFIGPVQSASRSFMAHLAPKEMMSQMFGLYALSGKVTSFIAPFFVATLTRITHSERLGMSVVFVLMLIGLFMMIPTLREEK
ncbi:MAG: MFS transporter [Simkaniaceae bacterium]|nr:MFS transporter [Simkaniaceae bacterium]